MKFKISFFRLTVVLLPTTLIIFSSITLSQSMDLSKISSVRAVVIGISDYEDDELDLEYARSDAEGFCDYLRSSLGMHPDSIRIKLLTDSLVTVHNIDYELKWLVDESRKGVLSVFYYSGHGDVERDIHRGFLLAYNTPNKKDYVTTAFPMIFLKDYIDKIVKKEGYILLIADACRSGKLAGGTEGTASITFALMDEWENTIKILSTQPNLLSYEYKEKKNGYFTYYLLRGLKGLADENGNKKVSLGEIEDYLEDTVKAKVGITGYIQIPMVSGDKETILTNVDTSFLASLKSEEIELNDEKRTATRGQNSPIASLDSITKKLIHDFKLSLKNGFLISSPDSIESAWVIYNKLKYRDDMMITINEMRASLINSLQNNSQIIIYAFLKGKNEEANNIDINQAYREILYADSLIDENSMFFEAIKVKCLFMESLFYDENEYEQRIKLLKECIALQPDAAFSYCELGRAYHDAKKYDEAIANYGKAIELSPGWNYPYYNTGIVYADLEQSEKAIEFYNKAIEIDSSYTNSYINLGLIYYSQGDLSRAIEFYNKSVEIDPNNKLGYYNLGIAYYDLVQIDKAIEKFNKATEVDPSYTDAYNYLGVIYYNNGDYLKAIENYSKALEMDPNYKLAYYNLGLVYTDLGETENALQNYNHTIQLDSSYINAYDKAGIIYYQLKDYKSGINIYSKYIEFYPTDSYGYQMRGLNYFYNNDYDKALEDLQMVVEINPDVPDGYYNLACYYSVTNNADESLANLEKAFQLGYNKFDHIGKDTDLDGIRSNPDFNKLIEKYKK